jgi:carbonic anhydrase
MLIPENNSEIVRFEIRKLIHKIKIIMEKSYKKLLSNNKKWVVKQLKQNPNYFEELSMGQSPEYLWIGCSDSRVPANEITGTKSGEIFVHRNIANMVVHTDMNMLSVLSYAVEVLKVKHIIVCGHYGCGGVNAAMGNKQYGLIDNWLRHLKDVYRIYHKELDGIQDEGQRSKRFVEVNVMEQVLDLGKTSIVQNAWKMNQNLHLHGWVYDIHDGIIKDLDVTITGLQDLQDIYHFE